MRTCNPQLSALFPDPRHLLLARHWPLTLPTIAVCGRSREPTARASTCAIMPTNPRSPEMTVNAHETAYDLELTGARVCDPATGLDRNGDLAVTGGRIAAIGPGLASHARQVIELDGKLLTAGWVDLHVHVFEWVTTFGLPPDDAGIHSGVTTAVDQGGTGAYTIPAFKHYIADCALTDIRCSRRSILPGL